MSTIGLSASTPSFKYNDGGRSAAGFKGDTRDCVTRSIAIATALPYKEVYDALNDLAKTAKITKRTPKKTSARTGMSVTSISNIWSQLAGSGFRR